MKSTQQHAVTFRQSDVEMFTKISHDRNPVHIQPQYARRTPFGQCLVYGILGAMAAIREPLKGGPLRLRKFSARFKRPLFVDVAYTATLEMVAHGQLVVSLGRGGVEKLDVEIEYELGGTPWSADTSSLGYAERGEAAEGRTSGAPGREYAGDYELATAFLAELKKPFGFQYAFLPRSQLTALAWASYFVGMEMPGRQALFLSCSMEFPGVPDSDHHRMQYRGKVRSYDAETSTLTIAADLSNAAGTVATVQLEAAQRPPPVEYRPRALEETVGRSRVLENKVALITGSSRGLGSLTALGCALHGADVILNCREGRDEADRVAAQITALGRKATVLQGDVRERETWLRMVDLLASTGRGLDLFVNNAFPPLVPTAFAESSDEDLDRFLGTVRATAMGVRILLPALAKSGGAVINISSEATQNPPREFSSYVVAKSAIEGLFLCLSKEYGAVRFVTVRPPRLLTDMTNGLVSAFQGRSPEGIVAAILRAMIEPANGRNHVVVDRFE
jgi:NAD(P)-dependent dehydrogenase (short-subunit alcohol dehydrogenase family)/acyl dehydratase